MTNHKPFCDCFECVSPDLHLLNQNHFDLFRSINNALGFGVKSGDVIEFTKVVNIYDGKGAGKVISPPAHLQVDHVTPEFIYFSGLITSSGLTTTYKNWYTYNNEDTYIIIPVAIKKALDSGDKAIDEIKNIGLDFSSIFGNIKWYLLGLVIVLILILAIKIS